MNRPRTTADINGGQVGKGEWFYARDGQTGRVGRYQCVSVCPMPDGLTFVIGSDDVARLPRECWDDERQAVIEALAQARNEATWRRKRAEQAERVVDSLVIQARSVGLDLDGSPGTLPIDGGAAR